MKLYLEAPDASCAVDAAKDSLLDGVLLAPELTRDDPATIKKAVEKIVSAVGGPVFLPVPPHDEPDLLKLCRDWASWHPQVVVTLRPVVPELRTVRALCDEGLRAAILPCWTLSEALFAGKAGAYFCGIPVGGFDDRGEDGLARISDLCTIFENYGFQSELVAVGIRTPWQVIDAAKVGCDAVSAPLPVLNGLLPAGDRRNGPTPSAP